MSQALKTYTKGAPFYNVWNPSRKPNRALVRFGDKSGLESPFAEICYKIATVHAFRHHIGDSDEVEQHSAVIPIKVPG